LTKSIPTPWAAKHAWQGRDAVFVVGAGVLVSHSIRAIDAVVDVELLRALGRVTMDGSRVDDGGRGVSNPPGTDQTATAGALTGSTFAVSAALAGCVFESELGV
jgi:hypothetical protein